MLIIKSNKNKLIAVLGGLCVSAILWWLAFASFETYISNSQGFGLYFLFLSLCSLTVVSVFFSVKANYVPNTSVDSITFRQNWIKAGLMMIGASLPLYCCLLLLSDYQAVSVASILIGVGELFILMLVSAPFVVTVLIAHRPDAYVRISLEYLSFTIGLLLVCIAGYLMSAAIEWAPEIWVGGAIKVLSTVAAGCSVWFLFDYQQKKCCDLIEKYS